MSKIDVTMIDGFDSMTPEQKVEALLGLDMPDSGNEVTKLKNALNKANSEAAEHKRALKELQAQKLSDDEKAALEREEMEKSLRSELETLKKEKTVASYKANYLANGYDDALATSTAEALASGDMATVFANQKAFNDSMLAKAKETLLNNQPGLTGGNPPKGDEDDASVAAFRKAMGL